MKPLELGATLAVGADANASFRSLADLGLTTAQVYPAASLDAAGIAAGAQANNVEITSIIVGFEGENYADIPTVRRTAGLVPVELREVRTAHFLKMADFAAELGVAQVQTHIGFVPESAEDPIYAPFVENTRAICEKLAARGQVMALETGQETAPILARLLKDVNMSNLRLNFDPANMIMYGNGTPLEALEILYPYIASIHVKDGVSPTQPNMLGAETPYGEGAVNFPKFLPRLFELGFRGSLTIEREIEGEEQRKDVLKAKAGVEAIVAAYFAQLN